MKKLPGSPLAYWSSRQFIDAATSSPTLDPTQAYVGRGASPHAFYFRAWWEVSALSFGDRWKRICRGGDYSPFYRSNALVIDWLQNGACVKEYILMKYPYLKGNYGWAIQDEDKYYIQGLTWGKRNERFNVQVMPADHIFTDEGQGIVPNVATDSNFLLGYLNSAFVAYFLSLTSGLQKHWVYIRPIPMISLSMDSMKTIGEAAREILSIKQKWDSTSEISGFYLRPLISEFSKVESLGGISKDFEQRRLAASDAISNARALINKTVFSFAELSSIDIIEVESLLATFPIDVPNIDGLLANHTHPLFDVAMTIQSYCFGAVFGRWDIRYTSGERQPPELPDPLDPLPVCPPGMLQNAAGLPAESKDVPADYPLRISWSGILVDDENHSGDIVVRVREAFEIIWKDRAEAVEQEACEILRVKSLREHFHRPSAFFADHLKRYSKSRRQAPIYWPLSTKSGSYTLWLYYHRITDQTLYACVLDLVEPKLKIVTDDLNGLRNKSARSSVEEKELAHLTDLEAELIDFLDELQRVAKFWKPNLNDGVQITAAPLWKLFQHKPWQKKLKETWEKLETGDYDWAHLSYSIWPERVLRKCHDDRSLAIAHEVETDFWIETEVSQKAKGKKNSASKTQWQPKKLTENEFRELIRQKRTTLKTSP